MLSNLQSLSIDGVPLKQLTIGGVLAWQATKEAAYENLVPTAIDTDGSIYNGCGYKDGYRVSSSGSIKTADSTSTCTGYIKINGGDIVRVSGITWAGGNYGSSKAIAFFDESFGWLGTATYQSGGYYGICTESSLTYTQTEGITTFVTPANTEIAYVVISGVGSGANMIVTINEEIT